MKAALILALVLGIEPQGMRELPETTCQTCQGHGCGIYFIRAMGGMRVPWIEPCWNCDGYGKERTMYGRLLKEK